MMRLPLVVVIATLAAVWTPQGTNSASTFSADGHEMRLRPAVAIVSRHQVYPNYSWVAIYFYAFPPTPQQLAAVSSTGKVDALEARRHQRLPGDPDLNHSRAVLHLLLDHDKKLSNASLEIPGLTCTILVDAATKNDAVQLYENDGSRVRLGARGTSVCDLTSVGGGRHPLAWNVDADVPLAVER